ncbi:16S rRNA (cytosine(1402)-N(4))-methyltransferase RsmH [Patescibacteria group bacterium]|nr:16S rRNA (cytosine(1402)-N(4))-methyltransferase RsmH [Patescibacteria group bacterium]MBU1890753.1 16S rRNA (cytosine(1402)-N(4))-methyltransferase RsmH [Patescibacteria group bacterium]
MYHTPVLLKEVISLIKLHPGDNVIDATLGGGGHAQAMLEQISPDGKLIGFDLDPAAIKHCKKHLVQFKSRIHLFQKNYIEIKKVYNEQFSDHTIRAILLDLGLSSYELKDESRGFSFLNESAPLDMRMSGKGKTAAELLNTLSKKDLIQILSEYGQEPYTSQIAEEVNRLRQKQKFYKVGDLAAAVLRVYKNKLHSNKSKPWIGGTHPATRTFQALRIAVNDELKNLSTVLKRALNVLAPGGRMAVISFHSLEDRVVKRYFMEESRNCICPPEVPVCRCGHKAKVKRITKKAIVADQDEIKVNNRSRSARLRVIEKI